MKRERFEHIDLLRAFAIVGMMAIHTLQYSLTGAVQYFFWNYLHFVEALFVFCSGFVLTSHYENKLHNLSQIVPWYKKRLIRLLVPFWMYIFCHYALWLIFPQFFTGLGLSKSITFIWQSIFLVGGVSLNWLVLLFVELTLLFPLFLKLISKKKILTIYGVFALTTTFLFTVYDFHSFFRLFMLVPWSIIFLLAIWIAQKDKEGKYTRKYFSIGLIVLAEFLFLFGLWQIMDGSLRLIDNKYPPNLFYLAYEFALACLAFGASKFLATKTAFLKRIISYLSVNSYSLFFIHFIVLDLTLKITSHLTFWSNVLVQLVLVLGGSILVSFMLKTIKQFYAIIASYNKTN